MRLKYVLDEWIIENDTSETGLSLEYSARETEHKKIFV